MAPALPPCQIFHRLPEPFTAGGGTQQYLTGATRLTVLRDLLELSREQNRAQAMRFYNSRNTYVQRPGPVLTVARRI
jgi:hypothetical protein